MIVDLKQAIELLLSGKNVAVPTETVYGLAARYDCKEAVDNIFTLKNRPKNNPLIIHIASIEEIFPFTLPLLPDALLLSKAFWPGPITLVLPIQTDKVPDAIRANLVTAAFRIPGNPLTRDLLKETGPLVMPSANLSGRPSATSARHIETDFGKDFPVLDGGDCKEGLESTIVLCDKAPFKIIRLGALSREEIGSKLGYLPELAIKPSNNTPLCPGQLFQHYSPKAKLHLCKEMPKDVVVVGFENRSYQAKKFYSLGRSDNPQTAAHALYRTLRALDEEGVKEAFVDIDFPKTGLFLTLSERLEKASGSSIN